MKTTTGIMLVAIGAVLSFAISIHPGFISLQIVGVILMLTGIVGLCLRQRGTGLLDRQLDRLRDLLGQDAHLVGGKRVPLDDLLHSGAAAGPASSDPGRVAIDDTPTSPDVWGSYRAATSGREAQRVGAGRPGR